MASLRSENTWISRGGNDFLQLIRDGEGVLSGIDATGTGYGGLAGGGSNSTQTLIADISSAQILNMDSSPITLIPAPGSGKFIRITDAIWYFISGTIAYVDPNGARPALYYHNNASEITRIFTDFTAVTNTVSVNAPLSGILLDSSAIVNVAVDLSTDPPADSGLTSGNGTAQIKVFYTIENIPLS